ncbi:MAG: ECF subfamily RNA polymerase sigma-24 factor [Acidobacteria bacterium OLB17]|nr:MAG: ECF subfamily RNA polymerase sigma-24 factor [Acidobacteria bacterium OLB17]MCZ2389968.1 hypothetical protein [Acidobacteriota bacterium]
MDTLSRTKAELDALMPAIYAELRKIAARHLRRERPNHTLQPTALVNEAFLLLRKQHSLEMTDRAYVLAIASLKMREILCNYAKRRNRIKRGSGEVRSLEDEAAITIAGFDHDAVEFLALEDALVELEKQDPELVRVVDLHFFGGLTFEEIAAVVNVSLSTINRRWRFARAWLYAKLK